MLDLKFFRGKNFHHRSHGFQRFMVDIYFIFKWSKIAGYSLKPKHKFDNFYLLKLENKIENIFGDVRDEKKLFKKIKKFKPDIIFHLAAQPLVKDSTLIQNLHLLQI